MKYEISAKYNDWVVVNGDRVSISSELEDTEILRDLATYNDVNIKESLAKNPNTPVEILAMLAESKVISIQSSVAANPNTTAETLKILARRSSSLFVLIPVAANPNTPVETLEILVRQSSSSLRGAVATNPNTPVETLKYLINYNSEYISNGQIMHGVAMNPNTPRDILANLAKSAIVEIRMLVATNPNTDADTLLSLYMDREKIVQEAVYERIGGSGFDSYVDYWTQES